MHKKNPPKAIANCAMPVKTRPAFNEPKPARVKFRETQDHARSRFNGLFGEPVMVQLKCDFMPGFINNTRAQMPKTRPITKPQHGVRHGITDNTAAVNENS